MSDVSTICLKDGSGGVFLPLFGGEADWSPVLRALLLLLGLLWCFVGIAMVSDLFMEAIEAITSQTKLVVAPDGRKTEVAIWNDTIANLTLMALGSSAPEILLSLVEVFTNRMFAGTLGPATIVGSAAFNLFVITAICIMALPEGEVKFIRDTNVYVVTSAFSLLAYVWMYLILSVSTPDLIEPWEGVATFLLFPLLLAVAFVADKGWLSRDRASVTSSRIVSTSEVRIRDRISDVRKQHGAILSEESIARFAELSVSAADSAVTGVIPSRSSSRHSSIARYRSNLTRKLMSGKRRDDVSDFRSVVQMQRSKTASLEPEDMDIKVKRALRSSMTAELGGLFLAETVVQFKQEHFVVLECFGSAELPVVRWGPLHTTLRVHYATRNGTAEAGKDYVANDGVLEFLPGEAEKSIVVGIIDDKELETEEDFFVTISNAELDDNDKVEAHISMPRSEARVYIIDDDNSGILRFESPEVTLKPEDTTYNLHVQRVAGTTGEIMCHYRMESVGDATGSNAFVPTTGQLTFAEHECSATVPVTIRSEGCASEVQFLVILENPSGCRFDSRTAGGSSQEICKITIKPTIGTQVNSGVLPIEDNDSIEDTTWSGQLTAAIYVNGSRENQRTAEKMDWAMHLMSVFWKLFLLLIPPVKYFNGWACFVGALSGIALLTAFIGDLAKMLGCVVGIPDYTTAITLVALGTSLPDTYASVSATRNDTYADAAIGNITGSNSVNVFLGIGLPWGVSAIYWYSVGRTEEWEERCCVKDRTLLTRYEKGFIVVSRNLWINVVAFLISALIAITVVALRRKYCGGELGGTWRKASFTILVFLWINYVVFSSCAEYV